MQLILPGHPQYQSTLDNAPLYWWQQKQKYVCDPIHLIETPDGLRREASSKELLDYVFGGELEEHILIEEKRLEDERLFAEILEAMRQSA
ncbi:hypothetical protein [Okeania sp. SIO2B3]|uniref:hypothetical protein n=1 Tax=Okeania sp. SIO2B3 TaxID=2607784 RepID=UPI0013C1B24C|nr:hypothetical protein [Okeania sp. SIO2B3]NET44840.1 hypothetical protein [Okeania sp. SIO2B3]